MPDKYVTETFTQERKVCPLTGEVVDYWECYRNDCSDVAWDKYQCETIDGVKRFYKCAHERAWMIESSKRRKEKEAQRKAERLRMESSLQASKEIYYDQFTARCNALNDYLIANAQSYNEVFAIFPYIEEGNTFLMYYMENGTPIGIHIADSVLGILNKYIGKMKEDEGNQFAYTFIPAELSESIMINLMLRYNREIKSQISLDNPIYLKGKNLNKYLDTNYGLTWRDFAKIQEAHPELTEIANYSNVIYIKQEIDEIIRRHDY